MRYFAHCAYKGGKYHGWQRQPNTSLTIQALLEQAFYTISRETIPIVGCGRTDSGVHASSYYFHFDNTKLNWTDRVYQLNAVLPYDISIYKIVEVAHNVHARFDANLREYEYYLHTYKNPFLLELSYHYKKEINIAKLNQTAAILIGNKDFTTFCKVGSDVVNKFCDVSHACWEEIGPCKYRFTIRANRFLRGMVRMIVGMCLHVLEAHLTEEEVVEALENQKPLSKYWSVPAEGLYLSDVQYPYNL